MSPNANNFKELVRSFEFLRDLTRRDIKIQWAKCSAKDTPVGLWSRTRIALGSSTSPHRVTTHRFVPENQPTSVHRQLENYSALEHRRRTTVVPLSLEYSSSKPAEKQFPRRTRSIISRRGPALGPRSSIVQSCRV